MLRFYLAVFALAFFASSVSAGEMPRDWSYKYFKEEIPLSLDTFRIAVLDPTPESSSSGAIVLELRELRQRRVGRLHKGMQPTGDAGGGWFLEDLVGQPSGGDPLGVVELIEQIANDPEGDEFATPVFVADDLTLFPSRNIHIAFGEGVAMATIDQALADAGVGPILVEDWLGPNTFVVDGGSRSGIAVLDAANALADRSDVIFASVDWAMTSDTMSETVVEYPPDPVRAFSFGPEWDRSLATKGAPAPLCGPLGVGAPNDPRLGESWGLEAIGDIDVDAPQAWQLCTGSSDVVVAVIGDGTQRNHPDMPGVLEGMDFTDECVSPPCVGQPQGLCDNHETIVASIIKATANNGLHSVGVAPDTAILPIRSMRYNLYGGSTCSSFVFSRWLADGIDYATEQGVDVINLSWNTFNSRYPDITAAFQYAYDAGIISFNSAGNGNRSVVYEPGRIFEVHSVTGINPSGDLFFESDSYASNRGPNSEFTGPGQYIFALDRTGADGVEDGSGPYGADATSVTGTSYASPHLAGLAALIRSYNPGLGPQEVLYILKETVMDLGDSGRDDSFGWGLGKGQAAINNSASVITVRNFDRGDLSAWSSVVGD